MLGEGFYPNFHFCPSLPVAQIVASTFSQAKVCEQARDRPQEGKDMSGVKRFLLRVSSDSISCGWEKTSLSGNFFAQQGTQNLFHKFPLKTPPLQEPGQTGPELPLFQPPQTIQLLYG